MLGTLLNQYRIAATLGAGGMGEVYRARDTRLNRDVAIKVLPKDFVSDADRLRRFEQEAKTLAALNHPNVLTIHDAGVHEGAPYLVSELLEGRTLREEMNGVALPVRKATEVAMQIAHGLAAAHDKGIIHRDLKPENLFVTTDERVKILDFGLAKLLQAGRVAPRAPQSNSQAPDGSRGATRIDPDAMINTTEPGLVLGTPAYMSPEQVRGEPADHRTDIFAFGCVLYEMLSGTRAFRRNTPVESMNAVLSEEPPDFSATNASIPVALERVVRRCLEKQPQQRFQSATDLAFAIENTGAKSAVIRDAAPPGSRSSVRRALPWALAACLGALLILSWRGWRQAGAPAAPSKATPYRQLELYFPVAKKQDNSLGVFAVISPDGKKLAYQNGDGIWVRGLDRTGPPVLVAASESAHSPFWSSSSAEIGYFDGRKLYRVAATGGRAASICTLGAETTAGSGAGAAWLAKDRIIFSTGFSGLWEVSADGGEPVVALRPEENELDFHRISPLPDGQSVLFIVHRRDGGIDTLAAWSRAGGRKNVAHLPGSFVWDVAYSTSGHVVFTRDDVSGGVWAFPFSLDTLQKTGEPVRLLEQGLQISAAEDATLVVGWVQPLPTRQLVWVDRAGRIVATNGPPLRGLAYPRLAPDGRRVVAWSGSSIAQGDIWMFDTGKYAAAPLTRTVEPEIFPDWFAGGKKVVFTRLAPDKGFRTYARSADGAAGEVELFAEGSHAVSRSGKYFFTWGRAGAPGLHYIQFTGEAQKPVAFPREFGDAARPTLSPDDALLAYESSEAGQKDIFVAEFPTFARRTLVSRGGGNHPRWHPNGSELFYLSGNGRSLMSIAIRRHEATSFGDPIKLFDLPESIFSQGQIVDYFDAGLDGQRFVMLSNVHPEAGTDESPAPGALVLQNWFEKLREKR